MSEAELSHILFATVTLLIASLICGRIFERYGMPRVIGEIVGGLALGPSFLGWIWPHAYTWLFGAPGTRPLPFLYWTGLILLMFISGFRVQREITPDDRRTILFIFLFAIGPPFAAGYFAPSLFDLGSYMGRDTNPVAFQLVMGIAVAVTSIPVISKIFIDLGLMGSRFAKIVLSCATLEDLVLWTALAVATALAPIHGVDAPQIDGWLLFVTVATTLGFLALSLWLGPRLLSAVSRHRFNPLSRALPTSYILAICLAFAGIASLLGINVIYGAFVAGIAIGYLKEDRFQEVRDRIADVSLSFFVPIYFALVGFGIDLVLHFDPVFTVIFIVASSLAKMLSVLVATRLIGKSAMSSFNLAMAMNTRGGPGIVLASIAYAAALIDERFYVTLVLAAVVTSLISGVWFRFVLRQGWELYE